MRARMGWRSIVAIACAVLFGLSIQSKAAYPDRPVHFIIGYAPGGGGDNFIRYLSQKLSEKWGQPVIVENRVGADGTIASDSVAHATPDGYTILLVTTDFTVTPSEFKLNFDPIKSFEPVSVVTALPNILVANPSLQVNSVKDLVALAKSKPGQLNFGSSGTGSTTFLGMALLMQRTGIKMTNITYKGVGPAMVALLGGEVQFVFGDVTASLPQAKAGKVKALAVSTATRVPLMSDLPTIAQATGLSDFDVSVWYAVLAPAGTPKDVVEKLHDDIVSILKTADVQEHLQSQGFLTIADSSNEAATWIKDNLSKWTSLIKTLDLK